MSLTVLEMNILQFGPFSSLNGSDQGPYFPPFPFFWIRYCIRLHHFVFVCFVFVCIKGMGHDGMVMGNVNVHSFIWKECNYCTSVCFEWNGDGGWDTDFPFFYHLWILINYSNYFLWYQNISSLTKNKINKTKIRLNICIQMHNN